MNERMNGMNECGTDLGEANALEPRTEEGLGADGAATRLGQQIPGLLVSPHFTPHPGTARRAQNTEWFCPKEIETRLTELQLTKPTQPNST